MTGSDASGLNHQSPAMIVSDLQLGDLIAVLSAGWSDFRSHPIFGLFFAAIFAVAGWVLCYLLFTTGELSWLIPAVAGFPLIAPFAAIGLYEVSRRHEAGIAITWPGVLGAVRGRGDDQILAMGVIIFVAFGFWVIIAHAIFSIAMVEAGAGSETLAFLVTDIGIAMLVVGGAIGAGMALAFYAITLVSLPMLLDREVDLMTAVITSLASIKGNRQVLLAWALFIAVALGIAMITGFVGLFLILPVLGHSTWHLYRRIVQ